MTETEARVYTMDEVRRMLRIGRNTVYAHASRGDAFPVIRIGGRLVSPKEPFDKWLAEAGARPAA